MKYFTKKVLTTSVVILLALFVTYSCKKDDVEATPPIVSFESSQVAVNTDDNATYNVKLRLSTPAHKDFVVKIDLSGTAIENEHFTVPAKEISINKGDSEGLLTIAILNENIWDEELTVVVLIAPGIDYSIDPNLTNQTTVKLTKEIVLPEFSFTSTENIFTNPFKAETIKLAISASEVLAYDVILVLDIESELTLGADFLVNNATSTSFTFPQGADSQEIEVSISKKDDGGFNENLKFTLTPADSKKARINAEKSSVTLEVNDPIVDLSPMFTKAALLGGEGYQLRQQIKKTDNTWDGTIVVNAGANTVKSNYLKTYRNLGFISAFDCMSNTAGGDVLRLSDLLKFATTDTTIADYGAAKTTRYFSPTDTLMRFVASGSDITKGTVTAPRQKFSANLILKVDWEEGVNTAKQWHVDSKATNGIIQNSTVPTFHTIDVWLEKLEGTYDFTVVEPEIVFTAWYKSDSKYFMRYITEGLDITKDGDLYKVTYRFYPRP